MGMISIHHLSLVLGLVGIVACLSAQPIQGLANSNKKLLHHERKASSPQVRDLFRKLQKAPASSRIEDEVNSVFDDASFFSSFGEGASPQAIADDSKPTGDAALEDWFRRILRSETTTTVSQPRRDLSFLGNQLSVQTGGVYGTADESGGSAFGGDGVRNRGGVRGSAAEDLSVPGLAATQLQFSDHLSLGGSSSEAEEEEEDEELSEEQRSGLQEAVSKLRAKSPKDYHIGGHYKKKSGKKDFKKDKRYKDEKRDIDHKLMKSTKSGKKDKNFSYDPYEGDDDYATVNDDFHFENWSWEWEESADSPMHLPQERDINNVPFATAESPLKGWNIMAGDSGVGGMMGRVDMVTEEGQYQFHNFLENVALPITTHGHAVGRYQFTFPSIQHTVYSGPVRLKARSNTDLSAMDPEIFAVLQSLLSPYLQEKLGADLHAYNLEVDYTKGHDKNAGKFDVVTEMEVKVTLKVVSDSIGSFRNTNHVQASQWIHEFFDGPDLYNVVTALKLDNIPVNEITFVHEDFRLGGNTISEANSSTKRNRPSSKNNEESNKSFAMLGITLSVLAVGLLFFLHHTGRLPSAAQIGQFSLNTKDKIGKFGHDAKDTISKRAHSVKMPSVKIPTGKIKLGKTKRNDQDENEEAEGGGRRRRTFSGTFRRFPDGGIRKAAIQKKPARSEEYLGDSASVSSSDSSSRGRRSKQVSSFSDMPDNDDFSFRHYAGDYGPPTPSRQSTIPPMTPTHQSRGEFSMPDAYDESPPQHESLLDKFGKTAAYLVSPKQEPVKSPLPSRAPRRITAQDIASPSEVDNWSIQSYETSQSSKKRSPSNHPLYRGWSESGPELRRPQLQSQEEPPGDHYLHIPFFT